MNKELSVAIIRLIVTFVLMLNAVLTAKGLNPIPFNEGTFTEFAMYAVAGISAIWSWWKNNNVTKAAQAAQEYVKMFKEEGVVDEL